MPLNPSGIFYADTSTEMSIADITAAQATSISDIINTVITTAVPVATIVQTAAAAAPTGWLLCQGQAVSRTTYAGLFAALGGTSSPYGLGDGSTTFNLPDMQGRVPVGKAPTGTFAALNNKAGAETVALDVSQMPSHTHAVNRAFNVLEQWAGSGAGGNSAAAIGPGPDSMKYNLSNTLSTGYSTIAAGSGLAHNNLQPYIVLNYAIKF